MAALGSSGDIADSCPFGSPAHDHPLLSRQIELFRGGTPDAARRRRRDERTPSAGGGRRGSYGHTAIGSMSLTLHGVHGSMAIMPRSARSRSRNRFVDR